MPVAQTVAISVVTSPGYPPIIKRVEQSFADMIREIQEDGKERFVLINGYLTLTTNIKILS